MDLETLWYEAFPFLYGTGGVVAILLRGESRLLKVSGVLLIVASLTIIRLRWVYRRRIVSSLPTAAEIAATPIHED